MLTFKTRKKTWKVATVYDAATKWEAYRVAEARKGGGKSGCSIIGNGGTVTNSDGNFVVRISYNGRFWNESDEEVPSRQQETDRQALDDWKRRTGQ